ncbi:MAG: endolytic transglycosylase MltG, partial [Prevotellaceae bacterium]|nr:endolytic transglycosylase MltG [Prevotellaceae bacterium]
VSAALSDTLFLSSFGVTPHTAMTLFIPNTYEVYWTISLEALFERMQKEYRRFWRQERLDNAAKIGLTPTEVTILASIVEEETNKAVEKPVVAGLYLNRLRKGMLLQSDPTAKFASGTFELTQILFSHTAIDSPYNTYRYAGLPPGPIRMPSIESIDAVLHHTPHNYIFMCAKETLNGEHYFTASLAEHNRYAAKYHAAVRRWKATKNK